MVEKSESAERLEIGRELQKFREYFDLSRQDVAKALLLTEENVTDIEEANDWNERHAVYLGIFYEAKLAKVSCYLLGLMVKERLVREAEIPFG